MISRRGFLLLCGASPGLWLAGQGLIALSGRMVLLLDGSCHFCGKDHREVRGFAGVVGRPFRICGDCLALCMEIIREERRAYHVRIEPVETPEPRLERIAEEVRRLLGRPPDAIDDDLVARMRARLYGARLEAAYDHRCSFCDARRDEVEKLIAGPRVSICDGCFFDGAALFAKALRG